MPEVDSILRQVRRIGCAEHELVDLAFCAGELTVLEPKSSPACESEFDAGGAYAIPGLVEVVSDLESQTDGLAGESLGRELRRCGVSVVIENGPRIARDAQDDLLESRAARLRQCCSQRIGFVVRLDSRVRQGFDLTRASAIAAAARDGSPLSPSELDTLFTRAARKGLPVLARPFAATDLDASAVAQIDARQWAARTQTAIEVESVERLLDLARLRGTRLILTPLASAAAVDLVEDALRVGVPVRAGTSVVHLLEDDALDAPRRVPPRRGAIDRERLLMALREGTLAFVTSRRDAPAVDPSARRAEDGGRAEPFGDLLTLSRQCDEPLERLVSLATDGLLDAFGLPREAPLASGAQGDFFLFEPESGRCVREFRRGVPFDS